MFSIGTWSDSCQKVHFEIFQKENRIISKELPGVFSEGDPVEYSLVDQSTGTPFIIEEALDTPEKQKRVFTVLTGFEINKEGKVSVLAYNPCHAWILTATAIATLYQAADKENSHHLIWEVVDHGERRGLSRIPADSALIEAIQACHNQEERTICLKDRRVTLIEHENGCLKSIRAEHIKSRLDSNKIITSDNWAVTVAVTANPNAGSGINAFMKRAGHASIVIESVHNLTHQIYCADLRAEDLKWNGSARAVVHLHQIGIEYFDPTRYRGLSETMVVAKVLVEKMLKRIKWEIAQQEQGTPKINYHVLGSGVNRAFYKTIDVFDSMEIYRATQLIDPPATEINYSLLEPSAAEAAWEALDDLTEESSTIEILSALVAPITAGFRDWYAAWRRLREIERQAVNVQKEAFAASIQRQTQQREHMETQARENGVIRTCMSGWQAAWEEGKKARKDYERNSKAVIPNLIRVEECPSFRPERGGVKDYIEVKTLPDNCDTWVMHKISLIGKRLQLDAVSEMWSIPSNRIGKLVLEDIPLILEAREPICITPHRLLELIRQTRDPIRIKEAETLASSMIEQNLDL